MISYSMNALRTICGYFLPFYNRCYVLMMEFHEKMQMWNFSIVFQLLSKHITIQGTHWFPHCQEQLIICQCFCNLKGYLKTQVIFIMQKCILIHHVPNVCWKQNLLIEPSLFLHENSCFLEYIFSILYSLVVNMWLNSFQWIFLSHCHCLTSNWPFEIREISWLVFVHVLHHATIP